MIEQQQQQSSHDERKSSESGTEDVEEIEAEEAEAELELDVNRSTILDKVRDFEFVNLKSIPNERIDLKLMHLITLR